MRTLIIALLCSACFIPAIAQPPQAFNYQAVARNNSGAAISNQAVRLRLSILDGSSTGPSQYVETHQVTTNQQGLFSLAIGNGSQVSGNFSAITWGSSDKYLKVELDSSGGTNYTTMGSSQLLSVPYALYSEKSGVTATTVSATNEVGEGNCTVVYTSSNAYAFYRDAGSAGIWYGQSLSGTTIGAAAAKNMVVVYTSSNAYAFYQDSLGTGTWYAQSLSGTPVGIVTSKHAVAVYTTSNAYAFHRDIGTTGQWYAQSLSGTPVSATGSGNHITISTTNNAYTFYKDGGSAGIWYSQSLSGTPKGIINSK